MPKVRSSSKPKRKTPLTGPIPKSVENTPKLSAKLTQSTISQFHTLLKRKAQLQGRLKGTASSSDHAQIEQDLKNVEKEMESLGGLERYQTMSKVGQGRERGGDSSKVLVEWLGELGLGSKGKGKAGDTSRKLKLLEIGALSPKNYAGQSSWIDNTPIDLHSQHPAILEQDFMLRPLPSSETDEFNIVSCSLVLNFVPEPTTRGEMLLKTRQHLHASPSSLLFLVLPLPCVQNSRYLSRGLLVQILKEVGYELVKERMKEGGKVGYWLFKWAQPVPRTVRTGRKRIICDGPGKNNFSIILNDEARSGGSQGGEEQGEEEEDDS